jgi:hypothetical protein
MITQFTCCLTQFLSIPDLTGIPPFHKDEIEKQVRTLLDTCLITNNTSPFASPVLWVQKKDGTWSFCVDYRKLNAITVKNKFPMSLVDEILDELQGSKFFSKLDFG